MRLPDLFCGAGFQQNKLCYNNLEDMRLCTQPIVCTAEKNCNQNDKRENIVMNAAPKDIEGDFQRNAFVDYVARNSLSLRRRTPIVNTALRSVLKRQLQKKPSFGTRDTRKRCWSITKTALLKTRARGKINTRTSALRSLDCWGGNA